MSAEQYEARVALVTDGARPIRFDIAAGLATEGATLMLGDVDEQGLHSVMNKLPSNSAGRILTACYDHADTDDLISTASETAGATGRFHQSCWRWYCPAGNSAHGRKVAGHHRS